jgi:hypothetical protein
LAKVTSGEPLSVPDGGHFPHARKLIAGNLALRQLIERAFTGDSRQLRGTRTDA